jgi:catechol 2,3-dioxygenase-like lactoylglutathione lyase family enzyme
MNGFVRRGIDRVLIRVRDLAAAKDYYRRHMEMDCIAEAALDGAAHAVLWRMGAGRSAWMRNRQQDTIVELIEYAAPDAGFIRDGMPSHAIGLFDIAFQVRDLDGLYARLAAENYAPIVPPILYPAFWPGLVVKDVLIEEPSRTYLSLIERVSDPVPKIDGEIGIMLDVAQFTDDPASVIRFYRDLLGLELYFDEVLPKGLINRLLGLPEEAPVRLMFLRKSGADTRGGDVREKRAHVPPPMVEVLHTGLASPRLESRTRPPAIGQFAIGFEVERLEQLAAGLAQGGFSAVAGPVAQLLADGREVTTLLVRAPGGVWVELYEEAR